MYVFVTIASPWNGSYSEQFETYDVTEFFIDDILPEADVWWTEYDYALFSPLYV